VFPIARRLAIAAVGLAGVFGSDACMRGAPKPTAGASPGTPHVSWVIMSGDRENPDRDFVCQSNPRNNCVVPASRADEQVFSDVHIYYHGAGTETKYLGSFEVGFFQGSPASRTVMTDITVRKMGAIANQNVTGIVTSTPGAYEITFELMAAADSKPGQPIRERLPVVVK
jgi:hypothetical protein